MNLGALGHLTYCTNIHAGESWPEVLASLESFVVDVKKRASPDRPFGVGLRLSALATAEIDVKHLRDVLVENDLYLFTINGFPYGRFHGVSVKQNVYRPDWREEERLHYTEALADVLAFCSTEQRTTISTVPGGFRNLCRNEAAMTLIARNILRMVEKLRAVEDRTGKTVMLALEPEPCCMLETTAEAIEFYQRYLLRPHTESLIRRYVGVCLDTCHAAVEFEDPIAVIAELRAAEIPIAKMQLSAGLRIPAVDAEAKRAIARFDEPTYLHQVVERTDDGELIRHLDLPHALATEREDPSEWRVHFHVPIFLERLEHFGNTQSWLAEVLSIHRSTPVTQHLEVETYTWDVLPERYRSEGVVDAISRELGWVRRRLEA
jgi:sugar phosphate isomerase/epimerase